MQDFSEASTLAKSLVTVSNESGCKTTALVTDMNQPFISKYRPIRGFSCN